MSAATEDEDATKITEGFLSEGGGQGDDDGGGGGELEYSDDGAELDGFDTHDPSTTQQVPASGADGQKDAGIAVDPSHSTSSDAQEAAEKEPSSMPLPLHWTRLGPTPQEPLQLLATADSEDPQEDHPPLPAGPNVVRCPQDVVDSIDPTDLELVIVGTAGQKITSMGDNLQALVNPKLEQLVLRSHLIREIRGIDSLDHLELLELYDNQLASLDGLGLAVGRVITSDNTEESHGEGDAVQESGGDSEQGPSVVRTVLRVLDMSYNSIRDMGPVQLCPNIQELYLANNKLKAMAGLQGLSKLKKLDLGANRIRHMDPSQLSGLTSLEELWLGKNKIEKIEGLEPLKNLRRLDLQSNRLTAIENLTSQVDTLEELYLSHNGIDASGCAQSTGLALPFSCLNVLDVSRNRVETTEPFAHLISLEELWLSGNLIETFEQVRPASKLVNLETIYLEHNPVQGSDPLYRKTLAALIPNLKQIDANMISHVPSVTVPASAPTSATSSGPSVPAATSSSTARPVSDAEELRRLQEAAIERAKAETEEKKRLLVEQQQQQQTQDGEGK